VTCATQAVDARRVKTIYRQKVSLASTAYSVSADDAQRVAPLAVSSLQQAWPIPRSGASRRELCALSLGLFVEI
jgi:hypothetical protein